MMKRLVRKNHIWAAAVLLIAVLAAPSSAPAAPPILLGTTGSGGTISTLVEIDPATGLTLSTIGPVGYAVNGLEYDATTGTLYGSTSLNDPLYNGLIEINLTTGAGTPVGVGVTGWGLGVGSGKNVVTNITVDSTGDMYGWWEWDTAQTGTLRRQDDLVSIDKTTGIATLVGESGLNTAQNGLGFDSSDTLYMINGYRATNVGPYPYYTVDTLNGSATLVDSIGSYAHHGDFDSSDLWYGISSSGSSRGLVIADFSTGDVLYTFTALDDNMHTLTFVQLPENSCFGINELKIKQKDDKCKGITQMKVTSDQGTFVFEPDPGKEKLRANTVVDDGVNGPVTIHTSCSKPLEIGDVFGAYTVTDLTKIFGDHDSGNEIKIKGPFSASVPIDLSVDDVTFTIDDGVGHAFTFSIPAGSFVVEGNPDHDKFRFKSAKGSEPEIDAKFDFGKCKFDLKVKKVADTGDITGTSLTVGLQVGINLVEEVVEVEVKHSELKYKAKPKVECCPKCKGITQMEVTSDQGTFVFEPDPGKEKLRANTVVDDGVNGPVTIHTSCSKPLEIGDVFGAYEVTDLVKIFD